MFVQVAFPLSVVGVLNGVSVLRPCACTPNPVTQGPRSRRCAPQIPFPGSRPLRISRQRTQKLLLIAVALSQIVRSRSVITTRTSAVRLPHAPVPGTWGSEAKPQGTTGPTVRIEQPPGPRARNPFILHGIAVRVSNVSGSRASPPDPDYNLLQYATQGKSPWENRQHVHRDHGRIKAYQPEQDKLVHNRSGAPRDITVGTYAFCLPVKTQGSSAPWGASLAGPYFSAT